MYRGHAVAWLRRYATSPKVTGSSLYEVIEFFFQFTSSFQSHYGAGVYSASNIWTPEDISMGKASLARKADNLTAIPEPIVWTM
jgi:hypothetical protein